MSQEKTEALVLRGVDFSESSRIITLLTPDRGRLACIGKGVRRKQSSLSGVLDAFNRIEILYYWKEGRQVHTLAEASLIDSFPDVKSDLERVSYAGFPMELACRAAHENEPSQDLYEAVIRGLNGLGRWQGAARVHACWQALQLLDSAGFAPALEECALCASPSLPAAPGFSWQGGAVCTRCQGDRRLSPAGFAFLQILRASPEVCPERLVVPGAEGAGKEVFDVLALYASHQFETDFRSVRVLKQMFG